MFNHSFPKFHSVARKINSTVICIVLNILTVKLKNKIDSAPTNFIFQEDNWHPLYLIFHFSSAPLV